MTFGGRKGGNPEPKSSREVGGNEVVDMKVIRHGFGTGKNSAFELNLVAMFNLISGDNLLKGKDRTGGKEKSSPNKIDSNA